MKKKVKQSLLFITDPWRSLDHMNDTSLRWMQESINQGIETHWADVSTLQRYNNQSFIMAYELLSVQRPRRAQDFTFNLPKISACDAFSTAVYRPDPPVDSHYLHPLQILAQSQVNIVNPASILFSTNEKTYGTNLDRFSPPTLAASNRMSLEAFGRRHKKVVLKPLHLAQSLGIQILDFGKHKNYAFEALKHQTSDFQTPVLLQKYLPEISEGEIRLWYLNGKLLGAVKKKAAPGAAIIDIDRGASIHPVKLNGKQKQASLAISSYLKKSEIRHAAIDLIGSYVTDFNITSPGLMVQMETILNKNLSKEIVLDLIK